MANRLTISDREWEAIRLILDTHPYVRVGDLGRCRAFLCAVLWVLRSGAQWLLLPATLDKWGTVFKRFSRWCQFGVWEPLHQGCIHLPDLQAVFIDSTINRAHACAAGAAGSNAEAEALGRSRGGFSTKVHALTDALGLPLGFILTGGQKSDIGQAEALLELAPEEAEALGGDKGYDCDALVEAVKARGMAVVIPPKANRTEPRECDWAAYKERHAIECFFGKIKHYRRIFSRFDKLARNYMGFLCFVSALIWLR